ncbi:hypothetical protein [Nitrincola sp. MINF-07-Sa-05]|uniref:hypothetical protein n=1 Tax=Nitrincola salilacus TaxID=3400273 RepID=UPI0039182CA7
MKLVDIRLLPSMAIARLGSASEPLDNYQIETDPKAPLDFRRITRAETFIVDTESGEITDVLPPSDQPPAFKSGNRIRPVAPFIEAFASVVDDSGEERLVPLDIHLIEQMGLSVRWQIEAGNLKVYRRTRKEKDKVLARLKNIDDHQLHPLKGECRHFIKDETGKRKHIPLGKIQFIKPTPDFPEIRLRFTPGTGDVYGSTPIDRPDGPDAQTMGGPTWSDIDIPPERILYDSERGTWNGKYRDDNPTLNTLSQGLYAAYGKAPYFNYYDDPQPARGYLDDACDGIVTLELLDRKGRTAFSAKARFCAAPPIFAPDSEFVRTVQDDVLQVLLGPSVDNPEGVPIEAALDIVRRAYETVRFMNVAVLNGDTVKGRPNHADTMPADDSSDFNRPYAPVMAPHSIDTLSITALHQQLYTTMSSGAAPWFYDLMRKPTETADLSDKGRRKMPALMSGADTCYLALTYRQLDTIKHAGQNVMFDQPASPPEEPALTPRNLTAQLMYRGRGNPVNAHIASSVGNCCPGLELDFRSVWKRAFEGITLVEHDNFVLDAEVEHADLKGHRLLSIEIPDEQGKVQVWPVVVQATGPSADGDSVGPLPSADSNDSIVNLEWSNTLSHIWKFKGQYLSCRFTREKMPDSQVLADIPKKQTIKRKLKVRDFFEEDSTVINEALASPGELTQGLCSPWQNDFRECVCYYWASSRPDYVNVEPSADGASHGDNWMQKKRTGQYVVDDYRDNRMINYQELFTQWETLLKFQIGGRDVADDPSGD